YPPSLTDFDRQHNPLDPGLKADISERSVLGKQILQIRLRQTAREAFFAQHVGNRLSLALLQFPDLFLDRSWRNQPVGVDGLGLADAMRAINGLGFDSGVPPRIVQ